MRLEARRLKSEAGGSGRLEGAGGRILEIGSWGFLSV